MSTHTPGKDYEWLKGQILTRNMSFLFYFRNLSMFFRFTKKAHGRLKSNFQALKLLLKGGAKRTKPSFVSKDFICKV